MAELAVAAIGLVAGFFGALGKSWLDRRSRIDAGLLEKRAGIYAELWRLTGLLPLYPRDTALTYGAVAARMEQLRDWYFAASGGIYLSRVSQKIYLEYQRTLSELVVAGGNSANKILTPEHYDAAREAGSRLRSSLTDDLHSRTGSTNF